jgi:endogenous inhibitor of DNA gyrase (YacG/DUF329 family)
MRCPICEKTFEPAASNAAPFCSERCRTIDLGRWLGETYGMPVLPDPEAIESFSKDAPQAPDMARETS